MTFGSAVLSIATVLIGLAIWRIQLIAKRRFDVAEDALVTFSLAKDAFDHVRGVGGYSGEGQTRERTEGETFEQKRHRDSCHVPIERLKSYSDLFSTLRKIQLLSQYHFGQDAYDAFLALFDARMKVENAAHMLLKLEGHAERHAEYERIIYSFGGEDDEIKNSLLSAQETLENVCKPHLKVRSVFWIWAPITAWPQMMRNFFTTKFSN